MQTYKRIYIYVIHVHMYKYVCLQVRWGRKHVRGRTSAWWTYNGYIVVFLFLVSAPVNRDVYAHRCNDAAQRIHNAPTCSIIATALVPRNPSSSISYIQIKRKKKKKQEVRRDQIFDRFIYLKISRIFILSIVTIYTWI